MDNQIETKTEATETAEKRKPGYIRPPKKQPKKGFVPPDQRPQQVIVVKEEKEGTAALTAEEQAIVNRAMKATTWPDESERASIDYSLMQDKFRYPEPCYEQMKRKKFSFRWITRKPERIDEMRSNPVPFRWEIANRVNTPFLADFIDKTLGCVVRLDQILVYRPWWMHEEEKEYDRRQAEGKDRPITSKDGEIRNDVEFVASTRSGETNKRARAEIGGDAIIAGDAEDAGSPMYEQGGGYDYDSASPL